MRPNTFRRQLGLGLGLAWTLLAGPVAVAFGQTAAPRPNAPAQAPPRPAPAQAPPSPGVGGAVPKAAEDPAARRKMDELLVQWEKKSTGFQTLDAAFVGEEDDGFGPPIRFQGRALLKSPNLAFLHFERPDANGKFAPYEQIRCTGNEVYHYKATTSQIFIYPLAPDERQRALEEGPLPFLFNMRAENAKRRYVFVFLRELPNYHKVQIIPRQKIDREAFSMAIVLLDKKTFLPKALRLWDPENGKSTKTYEFKEIRPNAPVDDKNFQGEIFRGWKVIRNPDANGRPQAAGAPLAPGRPALRPGSNGNRR
jgi:TIGR03009 family protein